MTILVLGLEPLRLEITCPRKPVLVTRHSSAQLTLINISLFWGIQSEFKLMEHSTRSSYKRTADVSPIFGKLLASRKPHGPHLVPVRRHLGGFWTSHQLN